MRRLINLAAASTLFGLLLLAPSSALACPQGSGDACREALVTLDGTVLSGAAPLSSAIAGAEVTIYQARHGGPKVLATATSDLDGAFSVALRAKDDDGIRYAVARKGEHIELAVVIGTGIPAAITINEMTTVATAYAMAQFLRKGKIAGKPLPLQVAAAMADNLVSAETGLPSSVIQSPPNANQTSTWRALGTLANILAACVRDGGAACTSLFALTAPAKGPKPATTLQAMHAIARNPTTNLEAIYALGDAQHVYAPYLGPDFGPQAPSELQRLDGFTLAVKVNATGRVDATTGAELCPFGGPGNIAFDENGYAWITNNVIQGTPNSTDCMVVLKPNGRPADGSNGTPDSPIFGGGISGQGYGIGLDPKGRVWAGNFGWGPAAPPTGSVSAFTPEGLPLSPSTAFTDGGTLSKVQGTISDQKGNIWMASFANDSVHVFPKGDPHAGYPPHTVPLSTPFHIQIDDEGFGWVSYEGLSRLAKLAFTRTGLVPQFTVALGSDNRPKGVALDSRGNAWVAAGGADAVYAVDRKGQVLGAFGGGGILGPWGVGVDSDDNVWIANFAHADQLVTKYRVSQLCGGRPEHCPQGLALGDPISPAVGYTLPSGGDPVLLHDGQPIYEPYAPVPSYKPLMRATAAHIDMAGNVWITNNWKPESLNDGLLNPGGDGIVIFVGMAAPVKPTFTGQPVAP